MSKTLVPATSSSSIADTGLISVNDLLGSARQGIKPVFAISRATMYRAIAEGRLPPPIKLSSRFMAWESRVIKNLVADLEAQGGAQ
jgi:predicted DNA-binding transcriptional regulator AlpA